MKKIKAFIDETVVELKKVVWPSREKVASSIKVVLISTILVALFFGVVDYFLIKGLYLVF